MLLYQVSVYDNYGNSEVYVVAANSFESAEDSAKIIHKEVYADVFAPCGNIEMAVDNRLVIESVFDANGTEYSISLAKKPREKFADLLKSGREIDCDIIINNCETSASFVWDKDCKLTPYGEEKFKEILDAEYTILPNGNIEIHSDNDNLGDYFVLAAAGYINNSEYIKLFGEDE